MKFTIEKNLIIAFVVTVIGLILENWSSEIGMPNAIGELIAMAGIGFGALNIFYFLYHLTYSRTL